MQPDNQPRVIELPQDVQDALAQHSTAQAKFDKLPYSHKKEYLDSIIEAKKPETRAKRIQYMLDALS
jgi:uncharacterized protein YdeI (YjbR/CyaY-like superfamily)